MIGLMKEKSELKRKVFIVDDHPLLRDGITAVINQQNSLTVCCQAGNVEEALSAIQDCKPNIVIIDLTLEQSSGLNLIEVFLHSYPDLLILVLSMHDVNIYAERCFKLGAKGYIMKQEPSEKLISALLKVLDGGIYVSDTLAARFLSKFAARQSKVYISPIEKLSNRELDVFQLIGMGIKRNEIAGQLNLSISTIDNHVENIKKKMKFRDTNELRLNAFDFLNNSKK